MKEYSMIWRGRVRVKVKVRGRLRAGCVGLGRKLLVPSICRQGFVAFLCALLGSVLEKKKKRSNAELVLQCNGPPWSEGFFSSFLAFSPFFL